MRSRRAVAGIHTVLAAAAVVAASAAFWSELVAPNLFGKRFAEVEPGRIYRSGKLTPAAISRIVGRHGIRTIVDLGAYPEGSAADIREQRTADSLGVTRYRMELSGDSTGNPNAYLQALRIMTDPLHQPVLVHCGAGTERTGCVVILYRHIIQGVSVDEAHLEARSMGQDPDRNAEFARTLNAWADPIEDAFRAGSSVAGAPPLAEPAPVASVEERP